MSVLYVYVDGSDVEEHEAVLTSAFNRMAARWSGIGAYFVDQQDASAAHMTTEDYPDRDLGINVPLSSFTGVQAAELLDFARELSLQTGRDFVVGVCSDTGIADDLITLGAGAGERELSLLCYHLFGC